MGEKYVKLDDIIETLENEWGYEGMSEDLYNLPAADVQETKYGKWLPTKIPSYFGGIIYECSLCGAKDGDHSQILGKYCWRCGAIMNHTPQKEG